MTITIDKAGRVVIPKAVREAAGLTAGTELDVQLIDQAIVLRPRSAPARLERQGNLLVIVRDGDAPRLDADIVARTLDRIQAERAMRAWGCHDPPLHPDEGHARLSGMRVTIDAAGRIVIPKPLREAAQLAPGTELDVTLVDDRLELRPRAAPMRLERRGRWLVAVPETPAEPMTAEAFNQTIDDARAERHRELTGD